MKRVEWAVSRSITSPPHEMILKVSDEITIGRGTYWMRHGNINVLVKTNDSTVGVETDALRSLKVGDAIRCTVIAERDYGFDNELVA